MTPDLSTGRAGQPGSNRISRSQPWILVAGAVILAAALAIGPLWYGRVAREQELREADEELAKIADLQVRQVEDWLRERTGDLEVLRDRSRVRVLVDEASEGAPSPEIVEATESLLDQYVASYGYSEVLVLDGTGRVLARSRGAGHVPSETRPRDLLASAVAAGPLVARYDEERSEGQGHLDFAAPVEGARGKGAVLLRMHPEALGRILDAPWTGREHGGTLVLDGMTRSVVPTGRTGNRAELESLIARAFDSNARALRDRDGRGRTRVGEIRPIAGVPWRLFVQTDADEYLRRVAFVQVAVLVNGLLLAVLAALVTHLILRKSKVREIRRSEEHFRTLIESAPIGILIGRDGVVRDFNPAALRIFGLSNPADVVGTPILSWLADGSREKAATVIGARAEGRPVPQELDLVGRRLDGTEFPIALKLATLILPDGASGIAYFTDVTEKRRAEQALRTSEEHYRTLIESTSDVIMIVDRDGFVRFAGGAVAQATGWLEDEMLGERWVEAMGERDRRDLLSWLARQADRGSTEPFVYRLRHKDDWWRDFEATASRLPHSSDLVVTSRDVTVRKELEAQLQRANRINSLGRLAGTIAHEFNNILMGILPSVELIGREVGPRPALDGALQRMKSSVLRGGKITREILRFTQPLEPKPKPFGVAPWLRSLEPELAELAGASIALRIEVSEPDLVASADPAHVHQALGNLVANAVAAMPEGGTLTVRATRPRPGQQYAFGSVPDAWRFVHFEVRDTGAGIAPDILPHVFEPLFTTRRDGGTGLGLPLVHQLVTMAGGHVYVETEPGSGSAFHLFIPAAEAAVEQPVAPRERRDGVARTILLVEDDEAVAAGLCELFEQSGRRAHLVTRGRDAEAAVESVAPDAVVLDVGLPDMDGIEVYQRLSRRWPDLPVVFSTGHGELAKLDPLLDRPGVGFLLKPYEIRDLLGAIDSLVASRAREAATE